MRFSRFRCESLWQSRYRCRLSFLTTVYRVICSPLYIHSYLAACRHDPPRCILVESQGKRKDALAPMHSLGALQDLYTSHESIALNTCTLLMFAADKPSCVLQTRASNLTLLR